MLKAFCYEMSLNGYLTSCLSLFFCWSSRALWKRKKGPFLSVSALSPMSKIMPHFQLTVHIVLMNEIQMWVDWLQRGSHGGVGITSRPASLVFPYKRHLIELTELVLWVRTTICSNHNSVFGKVDRHREVIQLLLNSGSHFAKLCCKSQRANQGGSRGRWRQSP